MLDKECENTKPDQENCVPCITTALYSILRTVVVVDRGVVGHYCLSPTAPYLGLAGVKSQTDALPVLKDEAEGNDAEAPPPAPLSEGADGGEEKKRVHLHAPAQTMYSTSSSTGEDAVIRVPGSRLFAITLRLRVTQIVAGIVMILLGAVACLEDSVRATLGLGIPTGVLTVLAAVANIQASRRFFALNFMNIQSQGNPHLLWHTQTPSRGALGTFRPFLPALACMLACLPLFTLSCMTAISADKNKLVLGCLLASSSAIVISTEASVWFLRWRWLKKMANS